MIKKKLFLLLGLFLSFILLIASASELETIPESNRNIENILSQIPDHAENGEILNPPTFGLMMLQMIGMLIFLSILLYFALYFFRKLTARYKNKSDNISLKLHENLYFSTKQGVSVISFGKKVYIVGFSQNSVSLIDSIDDQETINELIIKTQDVNKFGALFKKYFSK